MSQSSVTFTITGHVVTRRTLAKILSLHPLKDTRGEEKIEINTKGRKGHMRKNPMHHIFINILFVFLVLTGAKAWPNDLNSEDLGETPPRLYMNAALHVGYGRYTENNQYDQLVVSGPSLAATLTAGFHFARSWFIGGGASGFLFIANSGEYTPPREHVDSPISSGIFGAITEVGWIPRGPFSTDLAIGVYLGGDSGKWGGFGPALAPSATWRILKKGHQTLGMTTRLMYMPYLFATDRAPVPTRYIVIQAGLIWQYL
jgi:hypothetical protein